MNSVSLYSLLSACIGLVLLDSAIMINARVMRTGWTGALPIEVRYAVLFALILLVGLNSNQWMAGNLLFPLLAFCSITSLLISVGRISEFERREALHDGVSLVAIQVFTLLAIFAAFEMHRFWLLEAHNHDSLVYYQGLHWAMESPLFVAKEAVRARWELGVCGEGASWIGYDCPLYRGGTYTVTGWAQYFAPSITGNGLYFIAAYSATIAWFALRLLTASAIGRGTQLLGVLLTLAVAFSTGIMGALFNSNLATVMGGAVLALVVALALRTDLPPMMRFPLMAAWCAVSAHVYAESVFYTGLFISLVFLLELPRNLLRLHLVGIIRLGALLLLIVFGLGNIAVGQAFTSLFLFDEIAKGGEWFSWYLHQPVLLWSGSFIAGLLMGSKTSVPEVAVAAVISLTAAVSLLYSRQTRSGTLALIGTSLLAVIYIEVTGYQYGEHKVVHLLGPAWALAVVVAGSHLLGWTGAANSGRPLPLISKPAGAVIMVCLMLISSNFFASAVSQLKRIRGPHGIDFGLTTLASYVRPDDTVLVDDTAWVGIEKFHKIHYLIFQLHHQGAEVLLPNITGGQLRGGYFRAIRNDTLNRAEGVDWLVQSRGHLLANSKFDPPDATPVWENADYRLYRIGKKPVAVAGNGWYDCEPTRCWTVAPFEIEAYVPQTGEFELSINFEIFNPPASGTITVRSGDGRLLATSRSLSEQMHIELPQGWSRLVFNSDWTITSPLKAGVSADSRLLFAAIQRVEISPSHGQGGK